MTITPEKTSRMPPQVTHGFIRNEKTDECEPPPTHALIVRGAIAMYRLARWAAPRLPTIRLRDQAWGIKWRLWHALYGPHRNLWECEQ